LVATFFSIADPNFNCAACLKRNSEKHRNEKKGCDIVSATPVAKYKELYTFYRCPGALKESSYYDLIELHRLWEQGVLPYEGGVLDQSAKYIDAMNIVGHLKAEHQKDLEEKARKWQKTKSQSNSRLTRRTR
jgi:hypothetical protein